MAVSRSLCDGITFGTAAGLAFWGKSWPPVGRRWLAGVIGIYAVQALFHVCLISLGRDPRDTSSPFAWSIAIKAFDATVVAAGTVLWMEKLIPAPEVRTEN